VTQDEFRKEFDKAFWPTLGLHDRQPHAWWLALEEFAKHSFNEAFVAYRKEQEATPNQ
jgi:hypothetical protein